MIYVKFEKEIKGTVTVKDYTDWIEFSSYSLSAARLIQVQGADRDVSHANISEFMLTKGADRTSPEFFIQACVGVAFTKATIVVTHAAGSGKDGQRLLTIELEKPIVSSFSTQCATNTRPQEHISLNFISIKYTYNHFDGDIDKGAVTKEYHLFNKA